MKKLFTLLTVGSAFCSYAKTVTIYRSGTATTPVYTDIKSAVSAALHNDSLVLSADTFVENMIVIDKNLSVTGTSASGIKSTINASKDSTAIIFVNPEYATTKYFLALQHLDIINGSAQNGMAKGGGAICADYNTELTLGDSTDLKMNAAGVNSPNGGAIFSYGSVVVKKSARIFANTAQGSGGGIFCMDGFLLTDKAIITENKANGYGGGIYCSGTGTMSSSSQISGNTALSGGGIYALGADLYCINKGLIAANESQQQGGAIVLMSSNLTMRDSFEISANRVDTNIGAAIYAKGNNDIIIRHANIFNNSTNHLTKDGLGMTIYNDTGISGGSVISISGARILNPKKDNSRQNEIFNVHPVSSFLSDSTWWGESDTSKLIYSRPGTLFSLRSWTVIDWSINGGVPHGSLSSFPVEAYFRLNNGGKLNPQQHWMLTGSFNCSAGSFSSATAFMTTSNTISSTYYVPTISSGVDFLAIVDADTFRRSIYAIGLNIKEQAGNSAAVFSISPNPSQGNITISSQHKTDDRLTVRAFDLLGKVVFEKEIANANQKNEIQLNAAGGQYILELKDQSGNVWREKIVVQ